MLSSLFKDNSCNILCCNFSTDEVLYMLLKNWETAWCVLNKDILFTLWNRVSGNVFFLGGGLQEEQNLEISLEKFRTSLAFVIPLPAGLISGFSPTKMVSSLFYNIFNREIRSFIHWIKAISPQAVIFTLWSAHALYFLIQTSTSEVIFLKTILLPLQRFISPRTCYEYCRILSVSYV